MIQEVDEIARNLLLDRTCDNCKYNGMFSRVNSLKLPECHYWFIIDRKHHKAINPPELSKNNTCDKWEAYLK